jgi:hypothetical protein
MHPTRVAITTLCGLHCVNRRSVYPVVMNMICESMPTLEVDHGIGGSPSHFHNSLKPILIVVEEPGWT